MIQTAYLSLKLGWYQALSKADEDGLTPPELADKTNTSKQYDREWLEQQAVAGWIGCSNADEPAYRRRFCLPKARAAVLTDTESISYLLPMAQLLCSARKKLDGFVEAYKNDTGVSWNDLGDGAREAMAALNKPFFLQQLAQCLEKHVLDEATATKLHSGGGCVAISVEDMPGARWLWPSTLCLVR